ncbi:MAG: CRISPR-associated endoribonuclease Cas6 [Candidatus Cloacimonetes bacterium]|nr:CRISPR-associated endoribonuclease Cas6 [Candidatus Cloacimonadota bacterium]
MRVKISLIAETKFIIKLEYKSSLQAIIYSMLDEQFAAWLHIKGFEYEKRSFKLFCFRRFHEQYRFLKESNEFLYPPEVSFTISSPVYEILEQTAKNFAMSTQLNIAGNRFMVNSIEILPFERIETGRIRVNAVEPVEVHSTLTKSDGTPKTYYYSPKEKEFSELVNKNLQKKWFSFYGEECPHNIIIEPVNMKYCKERVQNFKNRVIKGWTGDFWLEGNPEILRFALDTGIGSSNSAGYGFIELVEKR